MTYTIAYSGTYPEDEGTVEVGTLEEVREWIKNNRSVYHYDYYNLRVYPTPTCVDVYELMDYQ